MFRIITRSVTAVAIGAGILGALSAPALAGEGRAYPAPGFPSSNASCVGAALDFSAHYGAEGQSFPVIVHGGVGPAVSGDATSQGPGAVGDFNSTLAQSHGPIWTCVA